jgi:hypothetical protein
VLFASVPAFSIDQSLPSSVLEAPGLPDAWGSTAIVVDLPSDESVVVGVALAERGFRPVPLYNGTDGPNPVVTTDGLVAALGSGSQKLKTIALRPEAPPAFLLDSNRRDSMGALSAGYYDNRWVVLPQDFPSATYLQSGGITEAILLQRHTLAPVEDLAHVLLRWQQGGLKLRSIDLATNKSEDLVVVEPSLFRKTWYAAIALLGLRRNNVGGFGSTVPEQAERTGFYG